MRISSVGAARIIGPSSSATRCSPMKNDDRPYIRWKRSSSGKPCQSLRSRVKSRSCVRHCWRSHRLYSCEYERRLTVPLSAECIRPGSRVAWKSSRSVRAVVLSLIGHSLDHPGWLANSRPGLRRAEYADLHATVGDSRVALPRPQPRQLDEHALGRAPDLQGVATDDELVRRVVGGHERHPYGHERRDAGVARPDARL